MSGYCNRCGAPHDGVCRRDGDHLRTRIAAAIYNASDDYTRKLMVRPDCPGASELEGDDKPVCYMLADAVIRELCMHRQEMSEWDVLANGFRGHRYVTHWEENDA